MALEHALLVSLREQPAAGLELARRFDRSIGFFWSATHQQIYKVLRRMEDSGWVRSAAVGQQGRREKTVYTVAPAGERALARWIEETTPREAFRSDLAVKLRGASYGDRTALLTDLEKRLDDHRVRLAHYESLRDRDYPDPSALEGQELDQYLVLRGGLLMEQFWIQWLTEYLEAHR
jgi:DNA-binding PadR family transcriptional regulator